MIYILEKNFKLKIKEYPSKWSEILCSWIRLFNVVTMFILLKMIYRFNTIPPIKIVTGLFDDVNMLKMYMEGKGTRIAKTRKTKLKDSYCLSTYSSQNWALAKE